MASITRYTRVKAFVAVASLGFAAATVAVAQDAAPAEITASVQDGVYTEEQADRGMEAFQSRGCIGCHGGDFHGTPGGPRLTGLGFMINWGDQPASVVFEWMRENMPPGAAGTLSSQTYADILATIFRANEFPAGDVELDPETLNTILIEDAAE